MTSNESDQNFLETTEFPSFERSYQFLITFSFRVVERNELSTIEKFDNIHLPCIIFIGTEVKNIDKGVKTIFFIVVYYSTHFYLSKDVSRENPT